MKTLSGGKVQTSHAKPGVLARLKKAVAKQVADPVPPWRGEGLTEEEFLETWTVR
jgi:hypothetical protein